MFVFSELSGHRDPRPEPPGKASTAGRVPARRQPGWSRPPFGGPVGDADLYSHILPRRGRDQHRGVSARSR